MAKKTERKSFAKKQPRLPDKAIVKAMTEKAKPAKKPQVYVAERNVAKRILQGWKIVSRGQDKKTNASDLILMEKN